MPDDNKEHLAKLNKQLQDLYKQREWTRRQIEAEEEAKNPSQVITKIKLDPDILLRALARTLREDMGFKVLDPTLLWTMPGGTTHSVHEARDIIFINRGEWAKRSAGRGPDGVARR